MTDEEKKKVQTFEIDGMMRTVDEIKSRRKKKGDFQYEISWKGLPSIKYNKWFTREVCPQTLAWLVVVYQCLRSC